jgi:hypothetical protein
MESDLCMGRYVDTWGAGSTNQIAFDLL